MLDFGVTASAFRQRYLEREPYLHRAAMLERPFDWAAIDALLHQIEPTPALMQLFHGGLVPQENYVDDVVDLGLPRRRLSKSRFYGYLQNGATLVCNRLELSSPAVKRACLEVGRFVAQQTLCNGYLSFGGQGTFGKHWDTHDVFVVQAIGSKRWQVYRPTFPLPLSQHTSNAAPLQPSEPPVLDTVLQAGDLLYIPRGWWHHVTPLDAASFHLSIGAYLPTVHDFMMWACSRVVPQNESARKGIGGSAYVPNDAANALQTLAEALRSPALLQQFLAELGGRELLGSEFNLGVMLDSRAGGLSPTASVRLTTYQRPVFDNGEITINGARLRLDRVSQAIVQLLGETEGMTVQQVCAQIKDTAADAIRARLVELSKHDIVSLGAE
ncbi:MAG: cupin domain-containing protein [Steroidobacteraceae bacterium]